MDTKLTLSLDKEIIERAKLYAKSRKISLSRLIESYLSAMIDSQKSEVEITPLVESLSGVVKLKKGEDIRENYTDYLMDKYK